MKAATAGDHQESDIVLCFICTGAFNLPSTLEGSESSFSVSTGAGYGVPRLNVISGCVLEVFPNDITLNHPKLAATQLPESIIPTLSKEELKLMRPRDMCTLAEGHTFIRQNRRGEIKPSCAMQIALFIVPQVMESELPASLYHFCLTGTWYSLSRTSLYTSSPSTGH